MTELDLTPPDVAQLVQLFSAQADLRFPDFDAAVLQDALVRVKERHLEVVRVEAQLLQLKASLEEEQESLVKKAQRGLAYLRVYAEPDEALTAKVNAIVLPRPRRAVRPETAPTSTDEAGGVAVAPRKRGRPRKVDSSSLFAAMTESPAPAAE